MPPTNIIDQLKRDEGFRPTVYKDDRGFPTIGYGHNLSAHPLVCLYTPGYVMSEEDAEALLRADLAPITAKLLSLLPWAEALPAVYLGVLENMSFNMGVEGLVGFHGMLTALQATAYNAAALEMISSKWYNEVGDRAKRLVKQTQTGVWQ